MVQEVPSVPSVPPPQAPSLDSLFPEAVWLDYLKGMGCGCCACLCHEKKCNSLSLGFRVEVH
ncbi:ELL-associated factor 1 [Clarias magur]|uniref:ELL-associated factor 1 n=1 Tax=Clarias magur TaxID=1594786 RepID=A0A8J4UKF8_CLAMG|nr:ELL-associated factor 1 [Clarias magur]